MKRLLVLAVVLLAVMVSSVSAKKGSFDITEVNGAVALARGPILFGVDLVAF